MKKRRSRLKILKSRLRWYGLPSLVLAIAVVVTIRFSLLEPDPPANSEDVCEIFREHPVWYDYASHSQERWGTPVATQMAFVYYESSFRSHAKPPRTQLLGFIPWKRPTTAYGYAQALDPAWAEYLLANGDGWSMVRTNMKYALDFVGWYNHLSNQEVGIALTRPEQLYLAYHEGRTGYRKQSYLAKPAVRSLAKRVEARALRYDQQLKTCEAEFQCWRFYEFWPFCGDW